MATNVKTEQAKQRLIEEGREELVNQFVIMCKEPISSTAYQNAFKTFNITRQVLINQGETWCGLKTYIYMTVLLEVGR